MRRQKILAIPTTMAVALVLLNTASPIAKANPPMDAKEVAQAAAIGYDSNSGVSIPSWIELSPALQKRVEIKRTLVNNRRSAFNISPKNLRQSATIQLESSSQDLSRFKVILSQSYDYGDGQDVQERSTSHVDVKVSSGVLVVDRISSDDPYDMYLNASASSQRSGSDARESYQDLIQEELKNIQSEQQGLSEARAAANLVEDRAVPRLNRSAMGAYQKKHAYSYNRNWPNFSPHGGDCANFASQVLKAGGSNFDTSGSRSQQWYFRSWQNRTPSWSSASSLRTYLLTNRAQNGTLQGQQVGNLYMKVGDPIFLKSSSGNYYHTLVTYQPYSSTNFHNIKVSAHTRDVLGKDISEYPGAKSMVTVR